MEERIRERGDEVRREAERQQRERSGRGLEEKREERRCQRQSSSDGEERMKSQYSRGNGLVRGAWTPGLNPP